MRRVEHRGMKISFLRLFFACAIVVLLSSCASYEQTGKEALAGTWTNSMGTVWTIHPDGTFDVDLDHDGKRDTWGKVVVDSTMMKIIDLNPKMPKDCKADGIYHFTRTAHGLHFTLVKDTCPLRAKNLQLDWTTK